MKVIAFNGSPRKKWSTETLLNEALKGAESQGAETELVHLYDLNFKGCVACFACKKADFSYYGKCTMKDELTPFLEKAVNADAMVLGAPVYAGSMVGLMKMFFERLMFPYYVFGQDDYTRLEKRIPVGFIYTMGLKEEIVDKVGYKIQFEAQERYLERIFGASETLVVTGTSHVEDYSKIYAPKFNAQEKKQLREEKFPKDCKKAYELGVNLVKMILSDAPTAPRQDKQWQEFKF